MACALFLLLLLWNFEDANGVVELVQSFPLSEYVFLTYPAILTLIEVTKQQYSFVGKLRDSKTMCVMSQDTRQVKEEIPSATNCLIYVFRTEVLGNTHIYNFEKNKAAALRVQDYSQDQAAGGHEDAINAQ